MFLPAVQCSLLLSLQMDTGCISRISSPWIFPIIYNESLVSDLLVPGDYLLLESFLVEWLAVWSFQIHYLVKFLFRLSIQYLPNFIFENINICEQKKKKSAEISKLWFNSWRELVIFFDIVQSVILFFCIWPFYKVYE